MSLISHQKFAPASIAVTFSWTTCLYLIFLWDVLRQPLRKLLPGHQLGIIAFGISLWMVTLFCWYRQRSMVEELKRLRFLFFPLVFSLAIYLLFAIAAGLYHGVSRGVMLLGGLSLLVPMVGIPIGFSFWRDRQHSLRLMYFFCLLNALAITSGIFEAVGVKSQILGGIVMEWYRFRGDVSIPLPSGVFRSPDLLGFHAALLASFAWLLYWRKRDSVRGAWLLALGLFGVVILILSARRKMLGLLIIFLATWILQNLSRLRSQIKITLVPRTVLLAITVSALIAFLLPLQVQYALTVITEMPERIWLSVVGSVIGTVAQSGWWGTGLGTATQGNTFFAPLGHFGWQEDALGRMVREGGVIASGILISGALLTAKRCQLFWFSDSPNKDQSWIETGLRAFFIGNVACVLVSHQHVSGDPYLGAILAFFAAGISGEAGTMKHD